MMGKTNPAQELSGALWNFLTNPDIDMSTDLIMIAKKYKCEHTIRSLIERSQLVPKKWDRRKKAVKTSC